MRLSKRRLLLALASLVLLESGARLALRQQVVLQATRNYTDDTWMRLSWLERHRRGIEIYYPLSRHDPVVGWRPRPDLRDFEISGAWRVSTNSSGFRGSVDVAPKQVGRLRVAALGDSYTFGDEVEDDQTYPFLLQQLLPEAEVLNLGTPGYGHDQMTLLLEQVGPELAPDIVVLGFVYIDIYRNELSFGSYAKPRFRLEGGELVLTGLPVPSPRETMAGELFRSRAVDLLRLLGGAWRTRSGGFYRDARALSEHVLGRLLGTIRALGATPVFVFVPSCVAEVTEDATENYLADFCRRRPLAWGSVRPELAAGLAQGSVRVLPGGHWSVEGNAAIAAGVRRLLVDAGLVRVAPVTAPGQVAVGPAVRAERRASADGGLVGQATTVSPRRSARTPRPGSPAQR